MNSVFDNVPTNQSGIFVRSTARSGCQVFLPVQDGGRAQEKKEQLEGYLISQMVEQPAPPASM